MNYFIFYTAVYGLSWIIVYSVIFEFVRNKLKEGSFLDKLTSCIVCTSYWVSSFFSLLYYLFNVLEINIIIYYILPYSAVAITWITGNLIGEFDD
jgi:hypothetical protein